MHSNNSRGRAARSQRSRFNGVRLPSDPVAKGHCTSQMLPGHACTMSSRHVIVQFHAEIDLPTRGLAIARSLTLVYVLVHTRTQPCNAKVQVRSTSRRFARSLKCQGSAAFSANQSVRIQMRAAFGVHPAAIAIARQRHSKLASTTSAISNLVRSSLDPRSSLPHQLLRASYEGSLWHDAPHTLRARHYRLLHSAAPRTRVRAPARLTPVISSVIDLSIKVKTHTPVDCGDSKALRENDLAGQWTSCCNCTTSILCHTLFKFEGHGHDIRNCSRGRLI